MMVVSMMMMRRRWSRCPSSWPAGRVISSMGRVIAGRVVGVVVHTPWRPLRSLRVVRIIATRRELVASRWQRPIWRRRRRRGWRTSSWWRCGELTWWRWWRRLVMRVIMLVAGVWGRRVIPIRRPGMMPWRESRFRRRRRRSTGRVIEGMASRVVRMIRGFAIGRKRWRRWMVRRVVWIRRITSRALRVCRRGATSPIHGRVWQRTSMTRRRHPW
mmetsp:Transcript_22832/g.37052  ORF Transcript_22832/g.37052 Transcript_22832/m.37052 type:complete len:215 (+) Transcript_22832:833-1477(+)